MWDRWGRRRDRKLERVGKFKRWRVN